MMPKAWLAPDEVAIISIAARVGRAHRPQSDRRKPLFANQSDLLGSPGDYVRFDFAILPSFDAG